MKEDIQRIMNLVKEGKITPEDAAEMIEAFNESSKAEEKVEEQQATAETDEQTSAKAEGKDVMKGIFDAIKDVTKEVGDNAKWQELGKQINEAVQKGLNTAKVSINKIKKEGLFGNSADKETILPLTVTEGKLIRIENVSGDVAVNGKAGTSQIVAKASVRAGDMEEAKKRVEEFTLIIEETDNLILLRQPDIPGLSVDIEVSLAVSAPIEVKTMSGDTTVTDSGSSAKITSQSGDVHLKGLEGSIEVQTQNGDMTVEDSKSPMISVEGRCGDVTLRRVEGGISVRTANGDTHLMACKSRTITVESVSGDVFADLAEPIVGVINLRTVNGDTHVSVPDGCDCRVGLSTLRGDVNCSITLEDEAKTEQHVTGRLGNGSGTLDVSAVNGDIGLKLRDTISTENAQPEPPIPPEPPTQPAPPVQEETNDPE